MKGPAMRSSPEFERIEAFIESIGAVQPPEIILGPGDDAAVLDLNTDEELVVSTDLSVEDVHFRREWLTWDAIGYRAVAAGLSDLAAMAARPIGVLVSIALPPELDATVMTEIGGGIGECLSDNGAGLLGGDVSRSPGPVFLDVTALGAAAEPVGRSGALPGDELWVTGRLGGAAAAATAWRAGLEPDPGARRSFERPRPRTAEVRWLADRGGVHAAIDLSDGLAADVAHIAAASSVGVEIRIDALPLHPTLEGWAHPEAAIALACGGGEDYEVLVALSPASADGLVTEAFTEHQVELTRIGRVTEGSGMVWRAADGGVREPPARGYDHWQPGAD